MIAAQHSRRISACALTRHQPFCVKRICSSSQIIRLTTGGVSCGRNSHFTKPRHSFLRNLDYNSVALTRWCGRRWYSSTKNETAGKDAQRTQQTQAAAAESSVPRSAPSWKADQTPAEVLKTQSPGSGAAVPKAQAPFTQAEFEAAFYEWFKKDKNWMLKGAPVPKFLVAVALFFGAMTYASLSSLEKSGDDDTSLETSVASAAIVAAELEIQPMMCLLSSASAMALSGLFAAWWVPRRTEKSMNIYANSYCDRVPKAATLAQARSAIRTAARSKGIIAAMFLTLGTTFGTVELPYFFFKSYVQEMNKIGWDKEPSQIPSAEKYRAYTLIYFGTCLSTYLLSLSHHPFAVVPAIMSSVAMFPLLSHASANIIKVTTRLARVRTSQLHQELALEDDLLGLSTYEFKEGVERDTYFTKESES